ncbi:hypothetical protein ATHEMM101B_09665 [Atlantibacter hermannii]|nr:Uncharacterised protein [Atlantibacter hermannii]
MVSFKVKQYVSVARRFYYTIAGSQSSTLEQIIRN